LSLNDLNAIGIVVVVLQHCSVCGVLTMGAHVWGAGAATLTLEQRDALLHHA
jgi:hypothetical protein